MESFFISDRKTIRFLSVGSPLLSHGIDGKGLGSDINPGHFRGPLRRNFTDKEWEAARTDGELSWILKTGSKGTAMAPVIPQF